MTKSDLKRFSFMKIAYITHKTFFYEFFLQREKRKLLRKVKNVFLTKRIILIGKGKKEKIICITLPRISLEGCGIFFSDFSQPQKIFFLFPLLFYFLFFPFVRWFLFRVSAFLRKVCLTNRSKKEKKISYRLSPVEG